MRFTTAAVVTGLAAVATADNSWGNQGSWGDNSWGSSSAASSSVASSTPVAAVSSAPSSKATPSNVWVTDVVTAFTTYCPEATAITHGGSTYSVTSATTLTITNCPGGCTITRPVSTAPPAVWTSSSEAPVKPTVPAPKPSAGTTAPWKPSANGTATGAWSTGSWSTPSSTPSVVPFKGAASKTSFGVAGLIAAFGLVAAL